MYTSPYGSSYIAPVATLSELSPSGVFLRNAALIGVAGGWAARSFSEQHSWLATLLGASAAVALYSAAKSEPGA